MTNNTPDSGEKEAMTNEQKHCIFLGMSGNLTKAEWSETARTMAMDLELVNQERNRIFQSNGLKAPEPDEPNGILFALLSDYAATLDGYLQQIADAGAVDMKRTTVMEGRADA